MRFLLDGIEYEAIISTFVLISGVLVDIDVSSETD